MAVSKSNRSLSVVIPEDKDPLSRIIKFMSNEESGIVLTGIEERILARLIYTHGLLTERKWNSEEIAEKVKERFAVSIHTARNDINKSYRLFSTVSTDYKKFTLKHHVEYIDQLIREWSHDKSLKSLIPKLLAEKTRAVQAMPVDEQPPNIPAPVIIINSTSNIESPVADADLLEAADELIKFEKEKEYLEFQDEPDEPKE